MKTASATEVKNRFGEYLEQARREPIEVRKTGRPVAVLMAWDEYERLTALDDAWWAEQAKKAEHKGYAGPAAVSKLISRRMREKLDLTHDALKFLGHLPAKQFRQVVSKIFEVMEDPEPHDAKALSGSEYRRADIGEYRIVYRFDREFVFVALIGKRNDSEIYKRLGRKR